MDPEFLDYLGFHVDLQDLVHHECLEYPERLVVRLSCLLVIEFSFKDFTVEIQEGQVVFLNLRFEPLQLEVVCPVLELRLH